MCGLGRSSRALSCVLSDAHHERILSAMHTMSTVAALIQQSCANPCPDPVSAELETRIAGPCALERMRQNSPAAVLRIAVRGTRRGMYRAVRTKSASPIDWMWMLTG